MTHDKLLARLDDYGFGVPPLNALRAVVELHKPLNSLWHKQIICESCQEGNDYPITYPCPTIQAIEEQLK